MKRLTTSLGISYKFIHQIPDKNAN